MHLALDGVLFALHQILVRLRSEDHFVAGLEATGLPALLHLGVGMLPKLVDCITRGRKLRDLAEKVCGHQFLRQLEYLLHAILAVDGVDRALDGAGELLHFLVFLSGDFVLLLPFCAKGFQRLVMIRLVLDDFLFIFKDLADELLWNQHVGPDKADNALDLLN